MSTYKVKLSNNEYDVIYIYAVHLFVKNNWLVNSIHPVIFINKIYNSENISFVYKN